MSEKDLHEQVQYIRSTQECHFEYTSMAYFTTIVTLLFDETTFLYHWNRLFMPYKMVAVFLSDTKYKLSY